METTWRKNPVDDEPLGPIESSACKRATYETRHCPDVGPTDHNRERPKRAGFLFLASSGCHGGCQNTPDIRPAFQ